jgi:hypothetical protein
MTVRALPTDHCQPSGTSELPARARLVASAAGFASAGVCAAGRVGTCRGGGLDEGEHVVELARISGVEKFRSVLGREHRTDRPRLRFRSQPVGDWSRRGRGGQVEQQGRHAG